MKNTKLTKILVFALSLALMIGAAVGISTSAETSETVKIVSQNVSYEGQTHLYYAVYYENVENPEGIALEVSYTDDEGNPKTVTVSSSEAVTLKDSNGADVACRAFRTPGVSAKNFTKVFTVKAVTESGTESAEKTYSVAEYCHQWLYDIAKSAEPTETELKIKAACESTLSYGTDIQALLGYYPADNTADHPENYVYVKGADGVTVNGAKTACVIKGSEITLAYTGTETRLGWEVYDLEGNEITVADDKFTANAYCTAAPELSDATGKYYLDKTALGTRLDYDAADAVLPGGSTTVKISDDETINLISITDGYLLFDNGPQESVEKYIQYSVPSVDTSEFTSICNVVEFDFAYGTFFYNWPVFIRFSGSDKIYFRHDMSAPDAFNSLADTTTSTSIGQPKDKFFNLRLEIYDVTTDGNTVTIAKLYINNEYVKDITASSQVVVGRVIIGMSSGQRNNTSDAYFMIDNVYIGKVDKAFVAGDPKAAE